MTILFKTCSSCQTEWTDREAFLSDSEIVLIGYQAHFEALHLGLFLFNHKKCKTTIAIEAEYFTNLYDGPVYVERNTGEEDCPGFCLHQENLEPCPARCECAAIREILQIIKEWPKNQLAGHV